MSFAASDENSLLALIFNATTWATMAQNAASSPLTNLYLSLHSADPIAGTQATSEATYTGYTREAVARTSAGFTVTANAATLASNVNFPAGTGGSDTITNFGLGVAATSTTALITTGTVTPNITTGSGITPQLTSATSFTLT